MKILIITPEYERFIKTLFEELEKEFEEEIVCKKLEKLVKTL